MKKQLIAGLTSLTLLMTSTAWSSQPNTATVNQLNTKVETMTSLHSGKNSITFLSQGANLAAHLYLPQGFDPSTQYPAVIFSPPFNQVKEQTGAIYATHLAKLGYAILVFDHLGYGDSEGTLRNNENAFIKMESIRDAISFVGTLPFINKEQLFGLGVCASGGYMALVATTDKRLKAIATVSGMMGNKASYFEAMDRATVTGLIAMQNAGRQKAYETGVVDYVDALGMEAEQQAINDGATPSEGYDYYMTARAGKETYPNYTHLAPSFMLEAPMLADAQSYAPYLYTPYIGIIGEKAMDPASGMLMTGPLTQNFYDAASEPKQLVTIAGASHVDLYDKEEFVSKAINAMDSFFKKHN